MSASFVAVTYASAGNTLLAPGARQAGDLLVVSAGNDFGTSVPSGWTLLPGFINNWEVGFYRFANGTASDNFPSQVSIYTHYSSMSCYRGLKNQAPVHSSHGTLGSVSVNSPSLPNGGVEVLLYGTAGANNYGGAFPGNYTNNRVVVGASYAVVLDNIYSTTTDPPTRGIQYSSDVGGTWGTVFVYSTWEAALLPPTAPSLGSPGAGATVEASGGVTFTWTHNDPDSLAQTAYSLRRRISGSGTWTYWNGSSWVNTEAWVSSSTASAAIAAGHFTDRQVWEWSVATRNTHTLTGPYATPRTFTVQDAAPTTALIAPSNQATVALTSGVTFQWSFNDPNDTQQSYALRRRPWGSSTWQWWNASNSSWSSTEVYNTSTSQIVTIGGAYWPSVDETYYWSVSVKDGGGNTTAYTSDFVVNPWEVWDGSAWVVTESPAWISTASTSIQAPKAGFLSGSTYAWTVRVRDAGNNESTWTSQTNFTFGGVVPREGWGVSFI